MKNQLSSREEDVYESSRLIYCWWRSAAKFDECVKLKLDLPNISSLTPRIRVLRELERLALIAPEGLNELRHKLLNYSSGDFWVPTGGIIKEQMDIPAVNTILFVGFCGSGKSSLVNLMYSVLGQSGLIPFAQTSSGTSSNYATRYMEEHNVLRSMRSGFCVYDSRGFNYDRIGDGLRELSSWMTDGVHHNQLCLRSGDIGLMKDEVEIDTFRSSSKFVQRRVDCAMVVANIAEIYKALKAGDSKPMEATRELFCSPALKKCMNLYEHIRIFTLIMSTPSLQLVKKPYTTHVLIHRPALSRIISPADKYENPILILTHGDMLSTEERVDGRLKICECLGISETNGVYDIVCLTEYGFLAEESDPVTAYAVTEAVYRALLISDRGHFPKKNLQDWAVLILSWVMCFIAALFAFLADICSKLGHMDKLKL